MSNESSKVILTVSYVEGSQDKILEFPDKVK